MAQTAQAQRTPTQATAAHTAPTQPAVAATNLLLTCGIVAGPVFVAVAGAQVLLRPGFDLRRHAISLLSLGDFGWIQIANFVVTGVLAIACAVGIRTKLYGGRAGTWGPILVAAYGVGLVSAGVFTADPSVGFPAGAPDGLPAHFSWHAILHSFSAMLAFLSLTVACLVFARRFMALGRRAHASYSIATGVVAVLLAAWPSTAGAGVRLALAAVLTWAWLGWLAVQLKAASKN
jgi:hypothetical membrane protein